MANILFIDDSPEIYNVAFSVLQSTHDNLNIYLSSNVRSTIRLLCDIEFDLVIMDVFIPIGENAEDTLGTRAKMYEGEYQHLGGLELLDFFQGWIINQKYFYTQHVSITMLYPCLLNLWMID